MLILPLARRDFVRVDRGLNSVDEVIAGVGHILSERISERVDLRRDLRKILWSTGRLVTSIIEPKSNSTENSTRNSGEQRSDGDKKSAKAESAELAKKDIPSQSEPEPATSSPAENPDSTVSTESPETAAAKESVESAAAISVEMPAAESGPSPVPPALPVDPVDHALKVAADDTVNNTVDNTSANIANAVAPAQDSAIKETAAAVPEKKKKKKKKKKKPEHPFQDYANFAQSLKKIARHRLLAINRGERAGLLNVKIEAKQNQTLEVIKKSVPADHPFQAFLQECSKDALDRVDRPKS